MKVKEEGENVGLKLNILKLISWHLVLSLHGKYMGKQWKQWETIFLSSKISVNGDFSHEIKRHLLLGKKKIYNKPRKHSKKQRHYFAYKGPSIQSYGFSSSHV